MQRNKSLVLLVIMAITYAIAPVAHAETPKLGFPLDCTLGQDCFTATYMDLDPSDDYADFTCGRKTYNGHKGTDIAIRSRLEMDKGVNVLAARDGTVLRMRNGEDDDNKTDEEYQAIKDKNKDCGNGILINHEPEGLQTFYCHLKKDSILVGPGDKVKEGQPIAQIGQSGFSEFPHLHFTVIQNGQHIDPFTGVSPEEGCHAAKETYWEHPFDYEPFTLYDGGFAGQVPDFDIIKAGTYTHPENLPLDAGALVYWVGLYHAFKGDELTLTIYDPDGQVFHRRDIVLPKNKKRASYFYAGRKNDKHILKPGIYTATAHFVRKDGLKIVAEKTYTHSIEIKEDTPALNPPSSPAP